MIELWTNTFPPTADKRNILTRRRGGGSFIRPSDEKIAFFDLVDRWARIQKVRPYLSGWVVAEKYVCWPDFRRRDTHNLDKVLFDAIEAAKVVDDDRFVLAQQMQVRYWPRDDRTPRPTFTWVEGGVLNSVAERTITRAIEEPGILVRLREARLEEQPQLWALPFAKPPQVRRGR